MKYQSFQLDNGLKVVVHEDHSIKVAVLNILYDVGSKDEDPDQTGFAHLFEHLMFGGSKNIAAFDEPLQKVGGENNAFTTPDYTNYYITIPSNNLETAFWLESDRMLSLSFDQKVLDVQKKVVVEEFKQRYLDQPYGDVWLKLRPIAYQKHPYSWPTIGKEVSHIEEAKMSDVKAFFSKYYTPNNAVLVVAGDVGFDQVKELSEKWFGPIPKGVNYERNLPKEELQNELRHLELKGEVPLNSIYKVYHMPGRLENGYYESDLFSDLFGRGVASRLYNSLVKEKNLMTKIGSYITGSVDPGLFVISGKLRDGASFEAVEEAIEEEISNLQLDITFNSELENVKVQAESSHLFSELEVLNRAMHLAYYTMLGDTELVNSDLQNIMEVKAEDVYNQAKKMLNNKNCSTLYYHKA
ncbi:MAG: insulinase family protein [Reichenbachiella sp.]